MVKEIFSVGTIVECDGEILILLRNKDKSQGNKWGLPAGRVEPNEHKIDTAIRELYEETGYKANFKDLEFVDNFDWHYPDVIVHFPTFKLKIKSKFDVKIDPKEHQTYEWVTPLNCYKKKNLIHGFYDLLEKIYDINFDK